MSSQASSSAALPIAWLLLALKPSQRCDRRNRQDRFDSGASLHINAGFSISGWLAVLLTVLLARVFAEGALMREDLEGVV